MKAVLAEKPSVAADIARVIGATKKMDGYWEGNGYRVTYAYGHLVTLEDPEAYGWKEWKEEYLPMIPSPFKIRRTPAKGVAERLACIKKVFASCDTLVNACDAGREGELIFGYIQTFTGMEKKPVLRLWISSLTDKSILDGFKHLQPGENYKPLLESAHCRAEADWLLGMNASRALSIATRGNYSLGRVQTPTLRIICERYLENKNFESKTFYQLRADVEKQGLLLPSWGIDKYEEKTAATEAETAVRNAGALTVVSVEKKDVKEAPPLLYDLTNLQKDANRHFSMSAEKTLEIAQALYEKKFMSYPRTGSRYISEDVYDIMPERIRMLTRYAPFADAAKALSGKKLNRKSVDDEKVTDHHALIATENLPAANSLSEDERKVYDMVVARMLEAFGEACQKENTSVKLTAAEREFTLRGSVIRYAGWRGVRGEQEEEEDTVAKLPHLSSGERLPIKEVEAVEKQTKPRPLHTEASLLAEMETAGKSITDEEARAAMKDCGLGTPATRAETIVKLFKREYIVKQKKSLVPTDKGLATYEITKDKMISNVELTGKSEKALNGIAQGKVPAAAYRKATIEMVKQTTAELLAVREQHKEVLAQAAHNAATATVVGKCPVCGKEVKAYDKLARCTDKECQFKIWRVVSGKKLSDKDFQALLSKGRTPVLKGFKSKAGKKFETALVLQSDGSLQFDFPKKK